MQLVKAILLTICVFTAVSLRAQPYYFRHYQVENGLSNNAVISCLQDSRGFLWFGTKDGLNSFDGYSFKVYRNNPAIAGSIGSNFIHCLYEDPLKRLWVGTEKGLYTYNATTESFSVLPVTANNPIRDITMDGDENLWFIMGFTLFKHDIRTNRSTTYPIASHFEATSICALPNGSIWASSSNGNIYRYQNDKHGFTLYPVMHHPDATVSRWIEKIYGTKDGKILIGSSNQGAKLFSPATHSLRQLIEYKPDKTAIFARNFLEPNADEYWIATESGIYVYNHKTGESKNLQKAYNDPYSISDNAVYTFCIDQEGGIWAGTYFGGINYYPRQHTYFKKYYPITGENSISGNVVREIREDQSGNLWIGTEDAGLNKYEPASGQFKQFLPTGKQYDISYTNIHGLLVHDNELWIGTFEHGLDVMDLGTEKVIRHYAMGSGPNELKSNFIFCLTQTKQQEIMVGTTRGAYLFNPGANNFSILKGMPLFNWYSYLLQDKAGVTWGATYGNGVNYYDPKNKDSINFRHNPLDTTSIASDRVNSIFEDNDGGLWFATESGLCQYHYETKTFSTYSTADGFPSNFLFNMLEDDHKNLWIASSKGLICFNRESKARQIFTTSNGLLNDQFNFNSAYKNKAGDLLFGSLKGFIQFNPKQFTKNEYVPPVYITGFQVFDKDLRIAHNGSPLKKSITYTQKISLSYQQSTFSIDFAGLNFTAPEMAEYAYRMEGLDEDWTYLKQNRKAYFTELKPGNYHFKVKASNSSGIWNSKEAGLLVEVRPPWWASKLAYGIYTVLVLFIVVFGILLYHRNIEAKNKRKFDQLQIAKEKEIFNAKIDFFTNVAHEIKTPLSLIKAPLEKIITKAAHLPDLSKLLKIMDRNTNRLVELSQQLLDFRQTEMQGFSLSFEQVQVSLVLQETHAGFKELADQKNIRLKLQKPTKPVYASLDLDAFNKILYNLLGNAIKYAKTKVMVTLVEMPEENTFSIIIKNDGYLIPPEMKEQIFEPFFRLKETQHQKGTGIGLALSKSLAIMHNGSLVLQPQEEQFNVFCLTLPLLQDAEESKNTRK